MCGIAGVIERTVRSTSDLEETARKMAKPLNHRGPDASGIWTDEQVGVGIGHQRLSIIDLSSAGAQPMVSACGRYVISYNGEIYNALELRIELESLGMVFRGHSDTEVLLESCAAWGVKRAAKRLIGMFAFALWDRVERCLYLVRDRIGIKPLYYSATPQRFLFASELTGLTAHPEFDRTIDRDAVDAYMTFDYVPAPFSIFRHARKIQAGTILRVNAGQPGKTVYWSYWSLEDVAKCGVSNRFSGTFGEAAEELESLLADAVKRRMISDVPLGAFLSGGIDSSTVVALMQKHSTKPVNTFTIGFSTAGFDEAPYAKAIAEHLGTYHCEHYVTEEEVREHGPSIIGHHDEPFCDQSLLPTRFLSRLARDTVTVALSGDGGDELFAGYDRHVTAARLENHPVFKYHPFTKTLFYRLQFLPRSMRMALARIMEGCAHLSRNDLKVLIRTIQNPEQLPYELVHGRIQFSGDRVLAPQVAVDTITRIIQQTQTLTALERQQFIDAACYLPDDILTKVDRASMAVSLEVRMPILDHRVVEFAFRLPPEFKTTQLESKRLLRGVLQRYVPETLFERPKQGFGAPVNLWMRGPLRECALDLMTGSALLHHDIVKPKNIRSTISRLRRGTSNPVDFRNFALAAWCEAHL